MDSLLRDPVDVDRHPSILRQASYDNDIRWRPGQTLYDLFIERCQMADATGQIHHPAIDADGCVLSYGELQSAVAAHAEALSNLAVGSNDRIGLLLDRSISSYCVMLAVAKIGAVFVPLDIKFPAERIRYIAEDAGLSVFVVIDEARELLADIGLPTLSVSAVAKSRATSWRIQIRELVIRFFKRAICRLSGRSISLYHLYIRFDWTSERCGRQSIINLQLRCGCG